jgi:hypothetical protein
MEHHKSKISRVLDHIPAVDFEDIFVDDDLNHISALDFDL